MPKNLLKGTYCLIISLEQDSKIKVGKLGRIDFKNGYYVYVGSALNSLEGRIKRHINDHKKLFWHVDYLLANKNAKIVDVLFVVSDIKWECKLASQISGEGFQVNDFGCSDCKCNSHLFYFERFIESENICLNAFKNLNLNPENLEKLKN